MFSGVGILPGLFALIGLATTIFYIVMCLRAVRSLESAATSLRQIAAAHAPPPTRGRD